MIKMLFEPVETPDLPMIALKLEVPQYGNFLSYITEVYIPI